MGRRGHKTPFSGKQKKAQLQARRARRRDRVAADAASAAAPVAVRAELRPRPLDVEELARCLGGETRALSTVQLKESALDVKIRARRGEEPFARRSVPRTYVAPLAAVASALARRCALPAAAWNTVRDFTAAVIPFFERPSGWTTSMGVDELDRREREAFAAWLGAIYAERPRAAVAPFEHNLEVWRQLWRVLERASIFVVVADIRCPLLHLPDALLRALRRRSARVVVALTKCDLVADGTFERWRAALRARFPHVSAWVRFDAPGSSFMGDATRLGPRRKLLKMRRGGVKRGVWCASVHALLAACGVDVPRTIAGENIDAEQTVGVGVSGARDDAALPCIGLLGQPSVGKSSLLNALMAQKVASVSITAGHTKTLQTHYVRPALAGEDGALAQGDASAAPIAIICDCPGVVFPRLALEVPRAMLEVAGSLMSAQVREPYDASYVPLHFVRILLTI